MSMCAPDDLYVYTHVCMQKYMDILVFDLETNKQVLCLLALPWGTANRVESVARNPLDFPGDEMYTDHMKDHFHCLERDVWESIQVFLHPPGVLSPPLLGRFQ